MYIYISLRCAKPLRCAIGTSNTIEALQTSIMVLLAKILSNINLLMSTILAKD